MAVYIINNMTIHDRAAYDRYVRAFLPIFRKYDGELLAAVDEPPPTEGEWPYDRTVVIRFPSREAAEKWYRSAEYQEIADRQERQIARLEAHADGQRDLIHRFQESNARLRERVAETRGRYELISGYARRQYEFMRKRGVEAEPPPPEPPPTPAESQTSSDALDFAVRQAEQSSAVLKKTRPPPPEGGA